MLGRAVGVLATSALSASAFLIPAGINPPIPKTGHLPAHFVEDAVTGSRMVRLPCSACAFSSTEEKIEEAGDDVFRIQGGANDVLLNYTTDGETLLMNSAPIFQMNGGPLLGKDTLTYYVDQVPASAEWADIVEGQAKRTRVEVVGAGVSASEIIELKNGDLLTRVRSTIFALGSGSADVPVKLNPVVLDVVQPATGDLMILGVDVRDQPHEELPSPPLPKDFFDAEIEGEPFVPEADWETIHPPVSYSENGEDRETHPPHGPFPFKDCKSLPPAICKLKHMIQSKIHGMRKGGCPGRMGGRPHNGRLPTHIKAPTFPRPDAEEDPARMGYPHHMRHGGRPHHHHHHHHRHHFLHSVLNGFATVLIPTLAGIAVGMTVSLVGLLVGRLISFFWIYVVRGGRRGYASVNLDDEVDEEFPENAVVDDEKEPLPVYEDAPAYEEVEKAAQ